MNNLHTFVFLSHRRSFGVWHRLRPAIVAAAVLFAAHVVPAQSATGAPQSSSPAVKKPAPRHTRRNSAQPATPVPQSALPPAPEMPHWPVNDTPNKAAVTWDSHGLRIQATNSSLHQILDDVSAETGAKVEGMGSDQRVFGEYGPGNTRDVISQLLHGSGYNVLMIGEQGAGTPRQIVLSARHGGNSAPNANHPPQQETPDEDTPDQPEADDQPAQPPMVNRPPMPPGQAPAPGETGAPITPQQVLQELQQRQQQMLDQQEQQQPH